MLTVVQSRSPGTLRLDVYRQLLDTIDKHAD